MPKSIDMWNSHNHIWKTSKTFFQRWCVDYCKEITEIGKRKRETWLNDLNSIARRKDWCVGRTSSNWSDWHIAQKHNCGTDENLQNLLIEEIFCVDRWGEHQKAWSTSQKPEIVSQCLKCSTQLVFNRLGDQLHWTIFHFFIAFMAFAFFMAGWAAGAACAAAFFIAFFMAAIVQKDERWEHKWNHCLRL